MSGPKTRFAAPALLVVLAATLPLAGCETTSDPLSVAATAPGQYDLYDCAALKVAARAVVSRQRELEQLMARANQGPAGGLVSATTYQPEYVTLRGKMTQLRQAAAANHCNFDPSAVRVTEPPQPAEKPTRKTIRKRRNTM